MKITIKDIAMQSTIASLYVVLVLALPMISFDQLQARIAEGLLVLVFFSNKHIIGLVIGTLIANLIGSPMPLDWILGTLATVITLSLMMLFKRAWVLSALFIPALVNGVIIGLLLSISYTGWDVYFINLVWVAIGEFLILAIVGIPLKLTLEHQPILKEFLK